MARRDDRALSRLINNGCPDRDGDAKALGEPHRNERMAVVKKLALRFRQPSFALVAAAPMTNQAKPRLVGFALDVLDVDFNPLVIQVAGVSAEDGRFFFVNAALGLARCITVAPDARNQC